MFGALIDYWWMTGDETYINTTKQAIMHQAAPSRDFMPDNQTLSLGNDDQGFWAMTAMSAAENKFPDPEEDEPGYLALAQACFQQWTDRWDTEYCRGGLRWQVFEMNTGFDYKNSISNGIMFQVAARLARYTGNDTYTEWAEKVWDWQEGRGLITDEMHIYDGAHIRGKGEDCAPTDRSRWTYNAGVFLSGAAFMTNITGEDKWLQRTKGLIKSSVDFFWEDDVIVERRCEGPNTHPCNEDQRTFKGYLLRWLATTATVVPELYDEIMELIRANAVAAARVCTGQVDDWRGIPNTACGLRWTTSEFDGSTGVGENMNAMSAVMYLLSDRPGQGPRTPATNATGGTSAGDYNAGQENHNFELPEITTADRAGAGILTSLMCLGLFSGVFWMMKD